jgi:hypothetical protein
MRRPRPSAMSLTIWSLKQKQGSKVKGVGVCHRREARAREDRQRQPPGRAHAILVEMKTKPFRGFRGGRRWKRATTYRS